MSKQLNLRVSAELKDGLTVLGGNLSDNARDGLRKHYRASFLSSRLGWPTGLCALVLGVVDLLSESADVDLKCIALTYDVTLSLALDAARAGVESNITLLPPKEILNRAAAIASALKDEA